MKDTDQKIFDIKPIETFYNGVLFRSRTEARWAVFFDEIGVKWYYEHEGYDLGLGLGYYLPDFFLPDYDNSGIYAEVKGNDFTKIEIAKCWHLTLITHKSTILLDGPPDFKAYRCVYNDSFENNPLELNVIPNADQASYDNRLYLCPGYENQDRTIDKDYHACLGDLFVNAVIRSKSYRF